MSTGTVMDGFREEFDSLGAVAVADQALWGAQTQRALENFGISTERMPQALIHALASIKLACAQVNADLGLLPASKAEGIVVAAQEVLNGQHDDAFVLSVWQSGSGTQTHMNMNEVLANLGSERMGGSRGTQRWLHPNDDVNLGQSSNDVFPSAMHVAAAIEVSGQLLPALDVLHACVQRKAHAFADIIKIGRTHLQDATPLTLGQEFSGHATQLAQARQGVQAAMAGIWPLAIGGTAVGTGLNTHPEFGARVAARLSRLHGLPFVSADNKFSALAAHDGLVALHGALKTLAVALMKIANDIRWLGAGPRSGLGELRLPANEPGSSIMPGKVNPTQCEALTMLCTQVMGNDVAITVGGASGNFELNAFKPLIMHNLLQSIRLLADGMRSFEQHCVSGIEPDRARIAQHLQKSLMLVTALVPHIGYDRAAKIARHAHAQGCSISEAALALDLATPTQLSQWLRPEAMLQPGVESGSDGGTSL